MPKREVNLKRLNYGKQQALNSVVQGDKQKDRKRNSDIQVVHNYPKQDSDEVPVNVAMVEKNNSQPTQRQNTERSEIIETIRKKKKWRICDECSKIAKYTNDSQIKRNIKHRKLLEGFEPEDQCVICDKNQASIREVDQDEDNVLLSLLYPRDFYDQYSREDKTSESLSNRLKNGPNTQLPPLKTTFKSDQTEGEIPIKRTKTNTYNSKETFNLVNRTSDFQRKEFHLNCQNSNIHKIHNTSSISRISEDEFTELYRRQGFRGWKLQKDKMLYPPEAFASYPGPGNSTAYTVNSLGLHFDIPDSHTQNGSRNLPALKHVRTANSKTKPKPYFPPIKTATPWSVFSDRLTL